MRSILRHISTHIQVGYVACLALGIAILCTLAIGEAFRAYLIGIDPFLPFTTAVTPTTFLFAIIYSGCLLVILPICLAPLIALSRGRTVLTRTLRARGRKWNTSILVLGFLNALLFIYISSLQRFGGVSVLLNRPHDSVYALSSVFLWLEQHIPKYLILGVPAAVSIVTASHHIFGRPKTQSFENYLGRLEYHALPMRFAAIHGRRRLNFNAGGLAPVLRGIRKQMLRNMDGYQNCIPGSEDARRYLVEIWNDCKEFLQEAGISETAGRQIRLFGSTSRALDRALSEFSPSHQIILSPYEHPTEHRIAGSDNRRVSLLPGGSTFLELPWSEQRSRLVEGLSNATQHGQGVIFLLSEVCWATGLRVPLGEIKRLFDELQQNTAHRNYFVIDGAHAVGNAPPPYAIDIADAYVFSGHKWLLAPEPCGILMSAAAVEIFDAWVGDVPVTTAGSSVVCGLRAALDVVNSMPVDKRQKRAATLKRKLLTLVSERWSVVGKDVGLKETSLFALKPKEGYKWKYTGSELRRVLSTRRINALVIDGTSWREETETWLRISVPFYSDWGEIVHFAAVFHELVTEN